MNERESTASPPTRAFDAVGRRLLLAGVLVALLFMAAMLRATDGHFVPQIVDLYVTCQYARAMAEGHPFQYNAGEAPSTGATSLLHTAFLGAAHALGARGEGLIAFAIATGVIFYLATILLARRLAGALGGVREGVLAGALIALGGPVAWGFFYGADIALFMLLATWLLERLVAEWQDPIPSGVIAAATLLSLARPEGAVFAVILSALWWRRSARRATLPRRLLVMLPLAASLGAAALNRAVTGYWTSSSVTDKSLIANYGLLDGAALAAEYLIDIVRGLLLGFYPAQTPIGFTRGEASFFFPPLALVFIMLAVCAPRRPEHAPALRLFSGLVALLFVFVTPNVYMGVHFHRYLLWAFPSLLILYAVGWGRFSEIASERWSIPGVALYRAGAGLALCLALLSTVRFAAAYGGLAGTVHSKDARTAAWIRRNLPAGASMLNIATSVEYLTRHRNMNLHGVTSAAFFQNRFAEREANVWEALARVPAGERPPYLISSLSAQNAYATLREIVIEPPLYQSQSLSDELLIFRTRYDALDRHREPRRPESREALRGLREVDRLNVGDRRDEQAHGYRFESRLSGATLWGAARVAGEGEERLIDGGRAILGEESFTVACRPGRELTIVLRTAPEIEAQTLRASGRGRLTIAFPEPALIVRVDDQIARQATLRPQLPWDEWIVRLPGGAFKRDSATLRVSGRYASFHYWFYQS